MNYIFYKHFHILTNKQTYRKYVKVSSRGGFTPNELSAE